MGRYTSDSGAGTQPRKKTVILTASTPFVPIPIWADIVYVTGCGAGGGGGNNTSAGQRGGGGGAGGYAIRVPMPIVGVHDQNATLEVVIGAAGQGAAASSNGAAADAGDTTISLGAVVLRLRGGAGGAGGANPPGGAGGAAMVGASIGINAGQSTSPLGSSNSQQDGQGLSGSASPLSQGASGAPGGGTTQGLGAGGISPFGGGGPGIVAVAGNDPGGAVTGFGGGGAGGNGTGAGSAGGPSVVVLEFEEAA